MRAARLRGPEGGGVTQAVSRGWRALLDAARGEAAARCWRQAAPAPADDRRPEAPLLAGAVCVVDVAGARRWIRRLLARAAAQPGPAATLARAGAVDPLAFLAAAVEDDAVRLQTLAAEAGVAAAPLRAVAPLAAMPLLQACGRALERHVPAAWRRGYCPICGAWPTLAEARGLERTRRFRCARCGADWKAEWLRCPFCDTTDHTRLGALVPEDAREVQRVETCGVCRGYVKVLTTLSARAPLDVALDDLDTIALDVAALEHGYARPPAPGHPLRTRLAGREPGRLRAWLS